jgi:hypothetical protein
MLKVTLFIQRAESPSPSNDDTIRMYSDEEYRDMVRVVYSTPELKREATFYLTLPQAMRYLHDTLKTLNHDSQPFEFVQVSTQIHPSVLYHVAELDDCEVRHLIEDTVETVLRQDVYRTRREH